MFLVGLTGGIASGKSTVSKIFQENGIPVIDADKISREGLTFSQNDFLFTKTKGTFLFFQSFDLVHPAIRKSEKSLVQIIFWGTGNWIEEFWVN